MKQVEKKEPTVSEKIGVGIDRLISIFSPKKAFQRSAYRRAQGIMASGYRGSSTNRLKSSWVPGGGSPDSDILNDLPKLRERSRDLNRNDAHAAGITSTMVTNTVGSGISLQSKISAKDLGIPEEKASELQSKCEDIWEKWCRYADASERCHFYDLQALVDRQILENGESLFLPLMISDPRRPYALALDMIESDRLDTPMSQRGDRTYRSGVEIGQRGEPVAYYVKKTHPGDAGYVKNFVMDDYVRIPARNEFGRKNIFHLYPVLRPGQTRGVPFFAPVLNYFKDLGEYMEAELVAARVAACFALFIKTEDQLGAALARTSGTNSASQRLESLEPGMIEYLSQGQEISAFNPNRPGGTFEPFVDRILRALATGLNLPYEIVAKDFSKTNYSSARAALLQAYRYFRCRQQFLATYLCQPVYEMLLEEAYLRGELDVPDFYQNQYAYTKARWIPQGWQWVDPLKEAESSVMSVEKGLSTLADECASQGKDWEEVLDQRARELVKIKELEEKNGIKMTQEKPAAGTAAPAPMPSEDMPGNPGNNKPSDQPGNGN